MSLENEYFECRCDSSEHVIRVSYFTDDNGNFDPDDDEIYIETQLPKQAFFGYWTREEEKGPRWSPKGWSYYPGRWLRGLRYILGYQCKYGHWESTIIAYKDAIRLREILDNMIALGEAKRDRKQIDKP